jgi:hypothetical protein
MSAYIFVVIVTQTEASTLNNISINQCINIFNVK